MDSRDALRLIAPAVTPGRTWGDLGAGTGTFTQALASLLGPTGRVYAVDRDTSALHALGHRRAVDKEAEIIAVHGDFTRPLELPLLDGALLANSLHFVVDKDQAPLLARLADGLSPGGVLVVVEYDNRPRSRWVPFPVSLARLGDVARVAGIGTPDLIGRRGSAFGGTMYAARMQSR